MGRSNCKYHNVNGYSQQKKTRNRESRGLGRGEGMSIEKGLDSEEAWGGN